MDRYLALSLSVIVGLLAASAAVFNYVFTNDLTGSTLLFLKVIGVGALIGSPVILIWFIVNRPPDPSVLPSLAVVAPRPRRPLTASDLGAQFGAKAGFFLSAAYSALFALPLLILPPAAALAILIAIVIGILPGTIIGWVTGRIIGWLVSRRKENVVRSRAGFIGGGTCLVIALVVHVAFFSSLRDLGDAYYVLLGIPTVMYILAGAWVGRKVFDTQDETVA